MSAPYRLSRHDFTRLQTKRRISGAYITLVISVVPGRSRSGFACVVSKKGARHAVDRNRIKRRVRAIFRDIYPSFAPGMVMVAYAKNGSARTSMVQLRNDIHTLLTKAHITPSGTRE